MKSEISTLVTGDVLVEVIAENAKEYHALKKKWEDNPEFERGYGKTTVPTGSAKGMVTGFYIPLIKM